MRFYAPKMWNNADNNFTVWEDIGSCVSSDHAFPALPFSHDLRLEIYRIDFDPMVPTTILTSPITEMLAFHGLPYDFNEDELSGFLTMVTSTDGCLGIAKGPALEDVEGGYAWVVMIEWESLANVKGQKSEAFAKAPKFIRLSKVPCKLQILDESKMLVEVGISGGV